MSEETENKENKVREKFLPSVQLADYSSYFNSLDLDKQKRELKYISSINRKKLIVFEKEKFKERLKNL